ncbi:Type-2 restriction enzyme EcoRII [Yersinia frederiksenii]|uniref:Type-2 restriction enzyme EcoRII n=2 Tax=Yersinia frederiksenii TaxID=29484 RepID=A0A380PVQ2_YERFR|nr:type II restriction endonuclease [Yersinia frederiksenii]KGA45602.1 type-2 restriction enzyme EcoRII [Yersinia frederiksenii ATCC 33641]SUP77675.1 Type-2 restriction enzyme EcoRII [Yersinia frederiksenii]
MSAFHNWLSDKSSGEWHIYIKRLSGNDTGATGGHQAGVYIPTEVIEKQFSSIVRTDVKNPDILLPARISSHGNIESIVRAIYYNNRHFDGTRNEKRITRWGKGSPLLNKENTGALTVFAFHSQPNSICDFIDVWLCNSLVEEELLESMTGEIIPDFSVSGPSNQVLGGFAVTSDDWKPGNYAIPEEWSVAFPSGIEIINYLPKVYQFKSLNPDELLLEKRDAEYSLFRRIEELHVLEIVKTGFSSVDDFISLANSVSNRRKSRAGRSLELHLEKIFVENNLTDFATQSVTEGNKKPDFLFPSAEAYYDIEFPSGKLRMLAVKTTCKDRWRQALSEANRIDKIHLFTLQEGVSVNQFQEMKDAGVQLVVPQPLHKKYPEAIRDELMSLSDFIQETKNMYNY